MNLVDQLASLPKSCGIYQYYDENDRLLYIGKAKNLSKRVRSYFDVIDNKSNPSKRLNSRLFNMISKVRNIKVIVVPTEQDALILENSLIKQLKPKYNVLLRDDKTYPYVLIDLNDDFPRLEIVRKIIKKDNVLYYGPYTTGISDIVKTIYDLIPLVQRKGCLKNKSPCLYFQMQKCLAPCANLVTKEAYRTLLNQAISFLKNHHQMIPMLELKMRTLADNEYYEEANIIKHRIRKIKEAREGSILDLSSLENLDIFVLTSSDKAPFKSIMLKIFMREGKVVFSDYHAIFHSDINNSSEIDIQYLYTQSIVNNYKQNTPIKLSSILVPIELENKKELEVYIQSRTINKTSSIPKIVNPKVGDKKKLIDLAILNANNILFSSSTKQDMILQEIKDLFKLNNIPNRIEIFDTSHHSSSNIVGSYVVYENNNFVKDSYRMFNLKGHDEYSQMKEMLQRRIDRYIENPLPDLWLIDGGLAQINIALEILGDMDLDVLAIAKEKHNKRANRSKGMAKDIIYTKLLAFKLDTKDKKLLFFQKLRDEAHRFTLSFHRKQKIKNNFREINTKRI